MNLATHIQREIAELLPRPRGHRQDARIQALASATSAASAVRKDMGWLQDGLTEALSAAVDPVVQEYTDLLAETQQFGLEREWDLFQGGMGPDRPPRGGRARPVRVGGLCTTSRRSPTTRALAQV